MPELCAQCESEGTCMAMPDEECQAELGMQGMWNLFSFVTTGTILTDLLIRHKSENMERTRDWEYHVSPFMD